MTNTHYAAVAAWLLDIVGLPPDQWRAARLVEGDRRLLAAAVAGKAIAAGWTPEECNAFLHGVYAGVRDRARTPDELDERFTSALERWVK